MHPATPRPLNVQTSEGVTSNASAADLMKSEAPTPNGFT